jgi:hypothetical protein
VPQLVPYQIRTSCMRDNVMNQETEQGRICPAIVKQFM